MPGGRGGRRQGTPGKGYANRTDLSTNYAPTKPAEVAAPPPAAPAPVSPGNSIYPEDIPKLDDPTGRPHEPVTAGLGMTGPGSDPSMDALRAAYDAFPTPQLAHVIRLMNAKYGI
jgi:hypothetical protein